LLRSDFVEEAASGFGADAGLNEDQITLLENGFIYYLLFIFSKDDLVQYLSENTLSALSAQDAFEISSAFISTLPEVYNGRSEINEEDEFIKDTSLATEIAETEQAYSSLQSIRTMAHDMNTAHTTVDAPVYTSRQADILNRESVTATPKNDGPRWDSEA
jgi:hypothetical protein